MQHFSFAMPYPNVSTLASATAAAVVVLVVVGEPTQGDECKLVKSAPPCAALTLSSSLPYADTSLLVTALITTEDVGRPRDMQVFVIVVRGMINYYSGGDGYRGSRINDCLWNGVGWMKGKWIDLV